MNSFVLVTGTELIIKEDMRTIGDDHREIMIIFIVRESMLSSIYIYILSVDFKTVVLQHILSQFWLFWEQNSI